MKTYERQAYENDLAFCQEQIKSSIMPPEMTKLFRQRVNSHLAVLATSGEAAVITLPAVASPLLETVAA